MTTVLILLLLQHKKWKSGIWFGVWYVERRLVCDVGVFCCRFRLFVARTNYIVAPKATNVMSPLACVTLAHIQYHGMLSMSCPLPMYSAPVVNRHALTKPHVVLCTLVGMDAAPMKRYLLHCCRITVIFQRYFYNDINKTLPIWYAHGSDKWEWGCLRKCYTTCETFNIV